MSRVPSGPQLPNFRFSFLAPLYIAIAILFTVLIRRGNMQILNPRGYMAAIQSNILWATIIFAAIVGLIMITGFFVVVFRYREDGNKTYDPKWDGGRAMQAFGWWGQLVVILAISAMVWGTTHQTDPFMPLSSFKKTITVQVVSLQWQWLFIYPDQHIATTNMLEIPTGTQVAFKLTAESPMNSFWVPQLSGQIYSMTGMVTQLHMETDHPGTYEGSPAEISGDEFAGMRFNVKAVSPDEFSKWATNTYQTAPRSLDYPTYTELAKPKGYQPAAVYKLPYSNLFDVIVMKYMVPGLQPSSAIKEGDKL